MQTATLRSAEPEKQPNDLESLGLSGATLMQLWGIGVASIPDLTAHNTDSLRKALAESLEGANISARVEKTVGDIHAALSARHLAFKEAQKEKTPAPKPQSAEGRVVEQRSGGNLDTPDDELIDKINADIPRTEKDPLWQFYQDMKRHNRILSRDEQFEFGRRVAEEKDMKARDTLVLHNLRLVLWVARKELWSTIARKKEWSALEFADLVQEGVIGLMIAAEKYDYKLGFAFSTYATWWVRQGITRAIMDSGFIRVPVHMGELLHKVRRAMNEIALREGRPPTLTEIATTVERTPKEVKSALRVSRMGVLSLSEPVAAGGSGFGEDDSAWYERIADETALRADHIIEAREELDAACARLNYLTEVLYEDGSISERNRKIFVQVYGLDGSLRKRTLESVAEGYDLTREMIRQIVAQCWDKLQHSDVDMDHDSVIEELACIAELEKLAGKRVSAS